VVPAILESERRPALVATSATPKQPAPEAPGRDEDGKERDKAKSAPASLPDDVDWKKVDEDKGRELSCDSGSPKDCTVVEGSGPHVLVVGDSHARMMSEMFIELAKDHDLTMSFNIVAGCMWQENLKNVQSPKSRQEQCTQARVGWYDDVLPELDPDVVVLAQLPRDKGHWERDLKQRDGGDLPLQRALLKGTKQTLRKIDKVSSSTVILESIAVPRSFEPNECLTGTKDAAACAFPTPTENRASDGFYITEAAQSQKRFTANLNPAFCPNKPVCDAVVDGAVVYRDRNHLTAEFAKKQRQQVWELLQETGAFETVAAS
jgi:SGNH domain (fused to AT3 domains)